jgi:glycine cleavage system pyridoxal-binding protein P
LVELGEACLAGAAYAAEQLAAVGVPLAFPDSPVGKEFALGMPDPAGVQRKLAERGHLVGPIVNVDGRELLLVAVTEQRTKQDVDDLARACRDIVGEGA